MALCAVELALDFVVLALYDVTVMCDDSASMKVRQQFCFIPDTCCSTRLHLIAQRFAATSSQRSADDGTSASCLLCSLRRRGRASTT